MFVAIFGPEAWLSHFVRTCWTKYCLQKLKNGNIWILRHTTDAKVDILRPSLIWYMIDFKNSLDHAIKLQFISVRLLSFPYWCYLSIGLFYKHSRNVSIHGISYYSIGFDLTIRLLSARWVKNIFWYDILYFQIEKSVALKTCFFQFYEGIQNLSGH